MNLGIICNEEKPEIAYDYLKRSIELTEVIGGRIVEEEHKMGFYAASPSAVQAYQLIVPLCLRLKNDKEAFEYVERSKSKTFLYILAASNMRPSVPIITSELKSLLDDEENYLRRAIPVSLDKMHNILLQKEKFNHGNSTILVEYFVTTDKVFIFVISPHEFHIKTVQLSSEKLTSYIESYWREVINYPIFKGNIGNTWLELSSYLIEPISEYLSHANFIYFVPYGLLHYIPIHALELNGEPLIKSHAVAYSPSSSLLQFYKNKGSGFLKTCASFGIVFKEEAEDIAKLFDTKPYLDASKNKVLEKINNNNNDILHFSCHGYFNNTDPLSSGIVLQDGILTAREIFDLRLNSELITLSACQTGLNESKPGDELIGLTRSLIYAGSASVVVSLWSVDAYSTHELMLEFYKLLKDGIDKATALQQAQIKIMQKEGYSHPYYWAPFILVGD